MWRSAAVEANADGASVDAISSKMGNSVDENKALQKTCRPVNLAAVRSASRRKGGRKLLRQERIQKVETLRKLRVETFQGAVANPLK